MSVSIERVEVICLQDPAAPYYRFEGSYRNVLVLVHGDNGLTGIGESDAPPEIVRAVIEMAPYNERAEGLAAIVTGEAVDDPRRLWDAMHARSAWHGRRGAAMHAISALDIAIWDLFARSNGIPVCAALGGARHERLPAYATIYPLEDEPARIDAQVAPLLEQGFRHLKICVDPWWAEPERVRRNLTHLRALVGPARGLMLDVAQAFTRLDQLAPFLDLLAALDFAWIEAPFPQEDVAEHARLKRRDAHPHRRRRPGPHHLRGVRALPRGRRLRHRPAGPDRVRRLHRGAAARADAGGHRQADRAARLQHRHHHRGQPALHGDAGEGGPRRGLDQPLAPSPRAGAGPAAATTGRSPFPTGPRHRGEYRSGRRAARPGHFLKRSA